MHARAGSWGKAVAAGTALLVPAAHPLLRPLLGLPSHLLWFSLTLTVAIVTYTWGSRGAILSVTASVAWVGVGEHLFGGGYGASADEATILALMVAVGFTTTLIAGFSLTARAEHERTRAVEAQLAQSQKMEAIGRLAGGVAHDFNNLLTVILSTGHVLRDDAPPGTQTREDIDTIVGAANSAADLTRQLLTFSRQQPRVKRVVDVNQAVGGMEGMLRRVVGEDASILLDLDAAAGHVQLDAGQLEQVVMNLVVNARDAMPAGGRIKIITSVQTVSASDAARGAAGALAVGRYAAVEVADTGVGMDEATRAHIFEPFFTTKPQGKGTGLGLSTVFGIVRDAGGDVQVSSRPGKGTCIRTCFRQVVAPAADPQADRVPAAAPKRRAPSVLLVEDQRDVRDATARMLKRLGYGVFATADGREALDMIRSDPARFRLVITDVVMPGMGGLELAKSVREAVPALPILFVSGYTGDGAALREAQASGHRFLQKPYDAAKLASSVLAAMATQEPVTVLASGPGLRPAPAPPEAAQVR